MSKFKIYLSASTQEQNIGVKNYGSEENQMFILRDKVYNLLDKNIFEVKRNIKKQSSLENIVEASNKFKPDLHLAFHTNAGDKSARGCEVYYSYLNKDGKGFKAAKILYKYIEELTPSNDRGVKLDNTVYKTGFYELRKTNSVAILCEYIFHTNINDVIFYLNNIDNFAKATRNAIYEYFSVKSTNETTYPIWLRQENIVNNTYKKNGTFTVNQIDIILKRFYEKFIKKG